MSALTICGACERGEHQHHRKVVQAVPPGMLGGSVCKCRGECVDGRYKPTHLVPSWLLRALAEGKRGQA